MEDTTRYHHHSSSCSHSCRRVTVKLVNEEFKELRHVFGYPYALPRSLKLRNRFYSSYTTNSTGLCDSLLPANVLAPDRESLTVLCGKMNPMSAIPTAAPEDVILPPRDWFDKQYFYNPYEGELYYSVLLLFYEISRVDHTFAYLYRELARINITMARYYRKMANYNRCFQRKLLMKSSSVPMNHKQVYKKKLKLLETLEREVVIRERRLVDREYELSVEERSRCSTGNELPDDERLLIRSQQARRHAELERQAAWVERAYAVHQRLCHRNDYYFTENEHRLVLEELSIDNRLTVLEERERRAKYPLLTKCNDLYNKCYEKIMRVPGVILSKLPFLL